MFEHVTAEFGVRGAGGGECELQPHGWHLAHDGRRRGPSTLPPSLDARTLSS